MGRFVALAVSLCATGCPKSGTTECRAAVDDLRTTMRAFDAEAAHPSSFYGPGEVVRLSVDAPSSTPPVGAPVAALARTMLILRGMPAGSASDAQAARRALERERDLREPGLGGGVRRDGDVAVSANAAAEAGFTKVSFAFEAPRPIAPPPATRVARALAEEHPPGHPGSIDFVYERCPDVGKALAGLSSESMSPEQKFEKLTARVPDGIERCGCKVDFAEVKDLAWYQRGLDLGRAVHVELAIASNGQPGCAKIAAPPGEAWSSASRLVTAAARGAPRGGPSCFALP